VAENDFATAAREMWVRKRPNNDAVSQPEEGRIYLTPASLKHAEISEKMVRTVSTVKAVGTEKPGFSK